MRSLALLCSILAGCSDLPADLLVDAPGPTPEGMVWVPGGRFTMGTEGLMPPATANPDRLKPDEFPAHEVTLDGFWMDEHEVTNDQFAAFVEATGHVTAAERPIDPAALVQPGQDPASIPEELLAPAAIVFNADFDRGGLRTDYQGWEHQVWKLVPGADWRHPAGPDDSIEGKGDHPVVNVGYEDARAYAEWAGKSLPTEAQWEYAARGGLDGATYPWGDEREPGGEYMCNYAQGEFPLALEHRDGFETTAPVGSFPPNGYGLLDMAGNVWEWTADRYHDLGYSMSGGRNPTGPKTFRDPDEAHLEKRVTRGGSFLCNANNCTGYRCAARMRSEPDAAAFHTGFRCVRAASP